MRKRMLFWLLGVLCVTSMSAQDMKTVFLSMPDSITPLLTKVNKEDCIDFLANDMKAEVKNRFGNVTEMKMLTDDYVYLQMTSQSAMELKLLPMNDSVKVVCMVKTVCGPACDSEVHFFSSDWKQELPAADFCQMPKVDEFFLTPETASPEFQDLRKRANMELMKVSLAADEASLTVLCTVPDYLNKEDRKKMEAYIKKEPITFRWENGKFITNKGPHQ